MNLVRKLVVYLVVFALIVSVVPYSFADTSSATEYIRVSDAVPEYEGVDYLKKLLSNILEIKRDSFLTNFRQAYYIRNGSFAVSDSGVVLPDSNNVIDIYFDPLCPHCVELEEDYANTLKLLKSNGWVINYHALSFLNDRTKNNYSETISAYLLAVAEYDPQMIEQFLGKVMSKEFWDKNTKNTNLFGAVEKVYLGIGGTNWYKISRDLEYFKAQSHVLSEWYKSDKGIRRLTDDRAYVPLVVVGGTKVGESEFNSENPVEVFEALLNR